MRERVRRIDREQILAIALQLRLWQDLDPVRLEQRIGVALRPRMTTLDRTVRRIVAAEEGRVDDHAAHDAAQSEPDDREVVAGGPLAAALPTVHPLAAIGVLVLLPDGLRGS